MFFLLLDGAFIEADLFFIATAANSRICYYFAGRHKIQIFKLGPLSCTLQYGGAALKGNDPMAAFCL